MNIESIVNRLQNEDDKLLVTRAYNYTKDRLSSKDSINRILGISNTLLDFYADGITIVGSMLSVLINIGVTKEELEKEFTEELGNIALETSRFNNYPKDKLSELLELLPEGKKILLIKLCERYLDLEKEDDNLSNKHLLAQDTIDYLSPLALKFRFGYIKSCLEDLCLYYLEPDTYSFIIEQLGTNPSNLKVNLAYMKSSIESLLLQNNINAVIKSRVKNIYSIYSKMTSGKSFDDIYDILALRILVEEESDCSRACDLIHSKYEMLPDRFKNYIESPKDNMYQSLHTTVVGVDGRLYEVQIRTNEMNKTAETGTASYVKYKENKTFPKK